ncbi:MAG: hypothetical protein HQL42_13110 [Alphaproteobacteria bacterium]|nr:hypothetical protein [Alphaproteobacteria bacterium]
MTGFAAALSGLNAQVMAVFGRPLVLIAPDGSRHEVAGEARQDPLLVDDGHATISTYQTQVGLNLHAWPPGLDLPDTDWRLEVPAASADADMKAGTWEIADIARPGDGWLEIFLTNFQPA